MKSALFSILWSCCLAVVPALAHNGEDHGVTPAMVGQTLEPRFEARGNQAEITGIFSEGQLWLFATRIASSEPWSNLKLEVESGGEAVRATETSQGVYLARLDRIAQPGRHALTVILQGEGQEELLTGELLSPAKASASNRPYGWVAAGLAALIALFFLTRRFSKK